MLSRVDHKSLLQVASGMTVAEVKGTLQGLLEEHVEALLDDDKDLPPDVKLPTTEAACKECFLFHVVVPNTVRR